MYDRYTYNECREFKFNPVIEELSNSDRLFFVADNRVRKPSTYKSLWYYARTIAFDNSERFVRERARLPGLEHVDRLKDIHIGNNPWPNQLIAKTDLRWDTENYYSLDATLQGIGSLYQKLNLPDYNKDYVAEYYNLWIKTIHG